MGVHAYRFGAVLASFGGGVGNYTGTESMRWQRQSVWSWRRRWRRSAFLCCFARRTTCVTRCWCSARSASRPTRRGRITSWSSSVRPTREAAANYQVNVRNHELALKHYEEMLALYKSDYKAYVQRVKDEYRPPAMPVKPHRPESPPEYRQKLVEIDAAFRAEKHHYFEVTVVLNWVAMAAALSLVGGLLVSDPVRHGQRPANVRDHAGVELRFLIGPAFHSILGIRRGGLPQCRRESDTEAAAAFAVSSPIPTRRSERTRRWFGCRRAQHDEQSLARQSPQHRGQLGQLRVDQQDQPRSLDDFAQHRRHVGQPRAVRRTTNCRPARCGIESTLRQWRQPVEWRWNRP